MEYLPLVVGGLLLLVVLYVKVRKDESSSLPSVGPADLDAGSVEAHVVAGRKIEAIKQLRRESGLGLKEAKDQVEALERTLRAS